jgi:hypothetical protein
MKNRLESAEHGLENPLNNLPLVEERTIGRLINLYAPIVTPDSKNHIITMLKFGNPHFDDILIDTGRMSIDIAHILGIVTALEPFCEAEKSKLKAENITKISSYDIGQAVGIFKKNIECKTQINLREKLKGQPNLNLYLSVVENNNPPLRDSTGVKIITTYRKSVNASLEMLNFIWPKL